MTRMCGCFHQWILIDSCINRNRDNSNKYSSNNRIHPITGSGGGQNPHLEQEVSLLPGKSLLNSLLVIVRNTHNSPTIWYRHRHNDLPGPFSTDVHGPRIPAFSPPQRRKPKYRLIMIGHLTTHTFKKRIGLRVSKFKSKASEHDWEVRTRIGHNNNSMRTRGAIRKESILKRLGNKQEVLRNTRAMTGATKISPLIPIFSPCLPQTGLFPPLLLCMINT